MNSNVQLYDTYKDGTGKRYRIIEVGNETVKLAKVNDADFRKSIPGRPRIITIADLFTGYTKINLPPVTVSKIEPQSKEKKEDEEVSTPSAKAAEIEAQAVREMQAHTAEKKNDVEILKAEILDLKKTISKMQQSHEAEVADYKDRIMELEILVKKKNEYAAALDNNSEAFEVILDLSRIIKGSASALQTMAARIEKETEGRI